MLVEVSVERIKPEKEVKRYNPYDRFNEHHEVFTVYIAQQRILTVYTRSQTVMTEWISDLRKVYRKRKQPLVVGFSVDRERKYRKGGLRDNPFQFLTLCVGSQCLIYELPEEMTSSRYFHDDVPKSLKEFLADSNTIFVGMHTASVTEKLEKDQDLKMKRSVDLYRLMLNVKGLPSLHRSVDFELDELIKMLLDEKMDVPRKIVNPWSERRCGWGMCEVNEEYAQFLTVDAFYAHEIGMKHLDRVIKMA